MPGGRADCDGRCRGESREDAADGLGGSATHEPDGRPMGPPGPGPEAAVTTRTRLGHQGWPTELARARYRGVGPRSSQNRRAGPERARGEAFPGPLRRPRALGASPSREERDQGHGPRVSAQATGPVSHGVRHGARVSRAFGQECWTCPCLPDPAAAFRCCDCRSQAGRVRPSAGVQHRSHRMHPFAFDTGSPRATGGALRSTCIPVFFRRPAGAQGSPGTRSRSQDRDPPEHSERLVSY
jgi:hypothetical protein